MATVNAVVLKHQKKQDGTWNVKICVNHKSTPRYVETSAYVTKSYLDSKGKLKRSYIDRHFSGMLDKYRDAIAHLGAKIDFMDPSDLRDYLTALDQKGKEINIIQEMHKIDLIFMLRRIGVFLWAIGSVFNLSDDFDFYRTINRVKDKRVNFLHMRLYE